jgi:hypothetical protein
LKLVKLSKKKISMNSVKFHSMTSATYLTATTLQPLNTQMPGKLDVVPVLKHVHNHAYRHEDDLNWSSSKVSKYATSDVMNLLCQQETCTAVIDPVPL